MNVPKYAVAIVVSMFMFVRIAHADDNPLQGNATADDDVVIDSDSDGGAAPAARHGELWMTDMQAAMAEAARQDKVILIDFTGSDWCTWCIRLAEEVFRTPEFVDFAKEKLILVEMDFPSDETKLDDATRQHHDRWLKKLQVVGFPTVMLADSQGRPFAQTGYKEGGPAGYVEHLTELLAIRDLRDKAMQLASAAEGAEKARYLDDALSAMAPMISGKHYQDEIKQLQSLGSDELKQKYDRLLASAQGGAEAVGIAREQWMSDPFGFLGADMFDASQHLEVAKTEPPVNEYHPRIEDRLKKLIELMSKT